MAFPEDEHGFLRLLLLARQLVTALGLFVHVEIPFKPDAEGLDVVHGWPLNPALGSIRDAISGDAASRHGHFSRGVNMVSLACI